MKKTINAADFVRAFADYGRAENFSREALEALFEYFESYEDSTGEQVELDVIAVCVEWSEFTLEELKEAYSSVEDAADIEEAAAILEDETTVVRVPGDETIVIANF